MGDINIKKVDSIPDHVNIFLEHNKDNIVKIYNDEKEANKGAYGIILIQINLDDNKVDITYINKETNVLAYYIICCEVFSNLPAFLKLCRENNEDYIFMKNKELWFSILMKIKQRKKMKNIYPTTNLLSTTMRMSAIELKVFY